MAMMTMLSAIRGRPTTAGPSPAGVPDIEYPSPLAELPDKPLPFVVKNTFIDTANCQPSSLLGSSAFLPRGVRSCPGSKIAGVLGLDSCCEEGEAPSSTSRSRSTSAGASTCSSPREGSEASSSPSKALPEFNYPAAEFSVRNTFVDTRIGQLPSMVDDAFEERKTRSCPSSGLGEASIWASLPDAVARLRAADDEDDFTPSPAFRPDDEEEDCDDAFVPAPLPTWASIDADALDDLVQQCQLPPPPERWAPLSFDVPPPPPPPVAAPAMPSEFVPPPPPPPVAPSAVPGEDEARMPLLGSPECPTVGSQSHCQGTCRPCAHAFTKGCANGVNCQFCHLCEQGELKRRQKERRIQLARQQAMDRRAEGCSSSGTTRGRRGGNRA